MTSLLSKPLLSILVLSLALPLGCKSDKDSNDEKSDETATESKPADDKPAAAELVPPSAAPTWIEIPGLGIQLEMPEGTKLDYDDEARRAHLRLPPLMVNIDTVDEYTAGFDKLNEKSPSLIEMITSEKTDEGFIVVKKVNSAIHNEVRFEANLRLKPVGTELSCGAAMPSRELSDAVVQACQSIKPL